MKTIIGISRDHSASMRSLTSAAKEDYNNNLLSIKTASEQNSIETVLNVVKCGVGSAALVEWEAQNINVKNANSVMNYVADGSGTPLFDSIGTLVTAMEGYKVAEGEDVNFLIMAITDGGENFSRLWNGTRLSKKIAQLQDTGNWSFVFRVPQGYARYLTALGIPAGNIIEWDLTEKGLKKATDETTAALSDFYVSRTRGIKATNTFYASLANLKKEDVQANLKDITSSVSVSIVGNREDGMQVRDFCIQRLGYFSPGRAFYELTKREKAVQDYKLIVIREKDTGRTYGGTNARQLLGIPTTGTASIAPGDHGSYDIFIQSTSVNRKLVGGTQLLYWSY